MKSRREDAREGAAKTTGNEERPTDSIGEVHRRELIKRGVIGFAVLWVGARNSRADDPPPMPRCGSYYNGILVGDEACGVNSRRDLSCGQPHLYDDWEGTFGQDFDCDPLEESDYDCTKMATSTGYHADEHCTASAIDNSCGLDYSSSEKLQDFDCTGGSATDSDCQEPAIGGGVWKDGYTGKE